MTTDLDARIRRAVIEVVDTAPPPPEFDGLSPPVPRNRPVRRIVTIAIAALTVVALAIGAAVFVREDRSQPIEPAVDSAKPAPELTVRGHRISRAAVRVTGTAVNVPDGAIIVVFVSKEAGGNGICIGSYVPCTASERVRVRDGKYVTTLRVPKMKPAEVWWMARLGEGTPVLRANTHTKLVRPPASAQDVFPDTIAR